MRIVALLLLVSILQAAAADYTIGIQQVQPLQPEPGDTVVFKVTVANEPRWSRVLNARVISPEGRIFELANIRYVDRAGSDIIHSEYVSWEVPGNAIEGNYTLEVNTPENVFVSTTFRVFRFPKLAFSGNVLTNFGTAPAKEVEVRATNYYRFLGDLALNQSLYLDLPPDITQIEVTYRYGKRHNETFPVTALPQKLRITTDFKDNIFHVNMSSEKLIENLELRILSEIPRRIKSVNDTHELRYYPISFIVSGQDYLYIGDAQEASARFAIYPQEAFIQIPLLASWRGGEQLVTWSGLVNVSTSAPVLNVSNFAPAPARQQPLAHVLPALLILIAAICAVGWWMWKKK